MTTFANGWYLIYTKPRHEKKVADFLQKSGIGFFLPETRKLRIWSDRKKYICEPLFPSYVFVRLENLQGYFASLESDSVLYYVRTGNQIARVSDSIIDSLRVLIHSSADNIEVAAHNIPPGSELIIIDGAFTGFRCEAIRYEGREKFLVRLDLLQRSVLADIPVKELMPVSAMQYYL